MRYELDHCHLNFSFGLFFKRMRWILGFRNGHGMVGDQFPLAGDQRVGSHKMVGDGLWPSIHYSEANHHGGLSE